MPTNPSLPQNALPLLLASLLTLAPHCQGEEAVAKELTRPEVARHIAEGVEVLNRLYWSPTLAIWLDRPGDDLRAHYDGRLNPPWWSSANAVETLLDAMKATGTSLYDQEIAALYEANRDFSTKRARVVAELKKRGQWSEADEAKLAKRQAQKQAAPAAGGHATYREFCNEYLDDSGWWALTWLKMYERTKEAKYLATAKTIHAHMAGNWQPDLGGGVMWSEDADKRIPNAITNNLFLILSARLYATTHEPAYLRQAEATLEWMHAKALYDGTGIVDVPGHHGDYWTYNQGGFIGGLTALFQATGKTEYLEEAVQVAGTLFSKGGVKLANGVLVEKLGTSGSDPGLFKGICVRYLGQLRAVLIARQAHPEIVQQIEECLRRSAASLLRSGPGADGLYAVDWQEGGADQRRNFNSQVSALALFVAVYPELQP